jgi:quercetin dioxygenase-like cupin family protein
MTLNTMAGMPALLAVLLILGPVSANADESNSAADVASENRAVATVASLMTRNLTGIDGKEAIMLTVDYPPGGSSPPHQHDAHVFVYVLEGTMRMQVDGHDPVTLKSGETFYESPQDVHRQSANASTTERAKILVLMVKDQGRPSSRPVGAEHGR